MSRFKAWLERRKIARELENERLGIEWQRWANSAEG